MLNKKILTLVTLGLLASPLSLGTANADVSGHDLTKKAIEHPVKSPLQKGILDFHTFNQLGKEINYARSFSVKSFNKMGTMDNRNTTSADDSFILEKEPNDEFSNADNTSYQKPLVGQLLSSDDFYDYDLHKVVVRSDGLLYVAGGTNSSNIELSFFAWEKNYAVSNKLVFFDNYLKDGVLYQVYKAKAGTYYVEVYDHDEEDEIDNNTVNDQYFIATGFVDNVAPNKPIVNKVDNNDKAVTGKAEANSTVTVKRGSSVLGTIKANSTGSYSVTIAVQTAGTKLTVTAKDAAGNVSAATTVTVLDVIAPGKPTVNKVDDNDTKVTGKAEANSTVTVKVGSKTLGSAKTDSKGNFTVKITAQKKDTIISVSAKDAAGNTSQATTVKVVKH